MARLMLAVAVVIAWLGSSTGYSGPGWWGRNNGVRNQFRGNCALPSRNEQLRSRDGKRLRGPGHGSVR